MVADWCAALWWCCVVWLTCKMQAVTQCAYAPNFDCACWPLRRHASDYTQSYLAGEYRWTKDDMSDYEVYTTTQSR